MFLGPPIMRFELMILGLCVIAAGCNADPRCRRETALLRAEILDLEDKYYLIKSERDQAVAELNAHPDHETRFPGHFSSNLTGSGINGARVIHEEIIYDDVTDNAEFYPNGSPAEEKVILDWETKRARSRYLPRDTIWQEEERSRRPNPPTRTYKFDAEHPETIVPLPPAEVTPTSDVLPQPDDYPGQPVSRNNINSPKSSSAAVARHTRASHTKSTGSTASEIVIRRDHSRGQDSDGRPGDDGLEILLQLKTTRGETVLEVGELTIGMIDPLASSANQRIGKWNFLPKETALFFVDENAETRGILLKLPWEQAIPRGRKVVVFVRYTTRDGRRLQTSAQIPINPPNDELGPAEASLIASGSANRESNTDSRVNLESGFADRGEARLAKPNWRPVR